MLGVVGSNPITRSLYSVERAFALMKRSGPPDVLRGAGATGRV